MPPFPVTLILNDLSDIGLTKKNNQKDQALVADPTAAETFLWMLTCACQENCGLPEFKERTQHLWRRFLSLHLRGLVENLLLRNRNRKSYFNILIWLSAPVLIDDEL